MCIRDRPVEVLLCVFLGIGTGVSILISQYTLSLIHISSYSEKLVHKELAQYRIRNDREFFILSYSKACEMIEKILIDNNMMYYKYDNKEK